ncbi:hypothetical protein DF186_16955, partial [Enterococcus hirae]
EGPDDRRRAGGGELAVADGALQQEPAGGGHHLDPGVDVVSRPADHKHRGRPAHEHAELVGHRAEAGPAWSRRRRQRHGVREHRPAAQVV